MRKNFQVKVNDSFEFSINNSDTKKLDTLHMTPQKIHVLKNNKSFKIKVLKTNFNKREYTISVNSNSYTVKIETPLDALINKMGYSMGNSKKANIIKAPMPGILLSVNVKEGQKITEGETIVILEAMKMENAIGAPKSGVIKTIHVKDGQTVEKGELLIEIA